MGSESCGCSAPCRERQDCGVKSPPGQNLLFLPSILIPGITTTFPGQVMVLCHLGHPLHGLGGVDEAGRGAQKAGLVPVRSRQRWRQTAARPPSTPSPGWNNPAAAPMVPGCLRGPKQPSVSSRSLIPTVHGKRQGMAWHGRSSHAGTSEDSDI